MMDSVIQPRGWVQDADKASILAALEARQAAHDAAKDADAALRAAVLAAGKHGASVRELAALTGLSSNTIQRWRTEA